jgi:hypothetical protein
VGGRTWWHHCILLLVGLSIFGDSHNLSTAPAVVCHREPTLLLPVPLLLLLVWRDLTDPPAFGCRAVSSCCCTICCCCCCCCICCLIVEPIQEGYATGWAACLCKHTRLHSGINSPSRSSSSSSSGTGGNRVPCCELQYFGRLEGL